MGFSTLNESKLHNSLKILYQEIYEGQTEVEQDGHVYDIVTKNGNVIEIQTKNLAKLLPKILDTIEKGHNVKLVHPIPLITRIELKDEEGNIISKRKSPKKGNIYDIFRELTGIYILMSNPHFSLEVLEIEMTEERIRTEEAVQSNEVSFAEVDNLDNSLSESNLAYLDKQENSASDSVANADLKQDIKSVLLYMDQLLENLPEDKIIEFAKSDEFVTYKKLFSELGLS